MKSVLTAGLTFALLFSMSIAVRPAHGQSDALQAAPQIAAFVAPKVFQAAGPSSASIQSSVDQYVIELGVHNNANDPGPLTSGHREINWDGGSNEPEHERIRQPIDSFSRNTRRSVYNTGWNRICTSASEC